LDPEAPILAMGAFLFPGDGTARHVSAKLMEV